MRAFSPVEAALAFALVGSLAAVLVPSFFRNLNASRLEEPAAALRHVAGRAAVLAAAAPVD
ncbi:MAG: hypothetical protein FJ104_09695, partial [Deltaproteobacteria bacterium]|nr:hypothetical protein [Deltaproteobacteria bacterium]